MNELKKIRMVTCIIGVANNAMEFIFCGLLFLVSMLSAGCELLCTGDMAYNYPLLIISIFAFAITFCFAGVYLVNYFTKLGAKYRYYIVSNLVMAVAGVLLNAALIYGNYVSEGFDDASGTGFLFWLVIIASFAMNVINAILTCIYISKEPHKD